MKRESDRPGEVLIEVVSGGDVELIPFVPDIYLFFLPML